MNPALVQIGEQFAAVLQDFAPQLAPMLSKHRDALIDQGFTRAEAVQMCSAMQDTIIGVLVQAGIAPKRRKK